MSDLTVPSYRVRPERQAASGRMLAAAGGLLGMLALGGAVYWGVSRMGPRPVPLIEPDPRPIKVKPEEPGGLVVPHQNETIFDRPGSGRRGEEAAARLAPPPEAPALDLLRLHQQPPPPPIAAPVAVPLPEPVPAPAPAVQPVAPAATPVAPPLDAAPATEPAVPAAPVRALPPPVAAGRAQIQLGALTSEAAAQAEWERLVRRAPELAGRQPQITRLEREGKPTLWRLRTGGLADRAAATELCEQLRGKGAACVPVGP